MDRQSEWIVVELTSRSESEDPDVVEDALRSVIGKDVEIFLPAVVTVSGSDRDYIWVMKGYAFVRRTCPDSHFLRLDNARYVSHVLTEYGPRNQKKLASITDSEIQALRRKVSSVVNQGIGVGDTVLIMNGSYKNITAMVVEEIPEESSVQIYIRLRSKETLVTLPRSFLKLVEKSPISGFFTRLTRLSSWVRMAKPLLAWNPGKQERLRACMGSYERSVAWQNRGRPLYSFINFASGGLSPSFSRLESLLTQLEQVDKWWFKVHPRVVLLKSYHYDPSVQGLGVLEQKLLELAWVEAVTDRVQTLHREISVLQRKANGDMSCVQNLIVDGHNLAFRCLYAPGMSSLLDSKGRPTGMIFGFLRSMLALKKRCPYARMIVTWDGSSQRRKSQCHHYKANRTSKLSEGSDSFDQLQFIQEILPLIGIEQVWNPQEEADDVIATLVRGDLKNQINLMFSTDRDLLQLVTDKTHFLVPSVGSRKEKYFNGADSVVAEIGVPPHQVIHFRAFDGDKSDQIPGVPRVPKKILLSLVRQHGTVDGVYKSSLSGTTKTQYERLHREEARVRLNLELMSLLDVPLTWVFPDLDVDSASALLSDLDVNPDPLIEEFRINL